MSTAPDVELRITGAKIPAAKLSQYWIATRSADGAQVTFEPIDTLPEEDLRDFVGRLIAYYQTYAGHDPFRYRREGQIAALADVLRFVDGDNHPLREMLTAYRPATLADIPTDLGGTKP